MATRNLHPKNVIDFSDNTHPLFWYEFRKHTATLDNYQVRLDFDDALTDEASCKIVVTEDHVNKRVIVSVVPA
jgi:hypothetical protein